MRSSKYYGVRRCMLFLAAATFVLSGSISLSAQPPHYLRKTTELKFTAKTRFDKSDGRTKQISGPIHFKSDGTEPQKVLHDFLSKNRFNYGIDPALEDIEIVKTTKTPGGTVVRFRQKIDGIPVYLSNSSITIRNEGTISWANISYRPNARCKKGDISAKKKSYIGAEAAEKRALEYLAPSEPVRTITTPEKWWFESSEKGVVLAWRVVVCSNDPHGEFEIFIDAYSGTVLQMTDLLCGYTGTGMVFNPDPLTTSGQPYGNPYSDNDDATNDALNNELSLAILRDITFTGAYYTLNGPNCIMYDYDSGDESGLTNYPTSHYSFDRGNDRFESVMCYYHIDKSARYIKSLDYWDDNLNQFKVDPHADGKSNGWFSQTGNYAYFGTIGLDAAEDAGVILHEYGHAIMHNIGPGIPSSGANDEAFCISEGSADYWDGSYTTAMRPENWHWHADWVSPGNNNPLRPFQGTAAYPFYTRSYEGGSMWASALMSIWQKIGKETTDRLFLQTIAEIEVANEIPAMTKAALLFINTEYTLYNGLHRAPILEAFDKYGFVQYIDKIPFNVIDSNYLDGANPYKGMTQIVFRSDDWSLAGEDDGPDNEHFLNLNHASSLNISTCSENTTFDTRLAVFSLDGTVKADNSAGSCGSNPDHAKINEITLPAGQYYIVVDGDYDDPTDVSSHGAYELSVAYSRSLEIYTKDNGLSLPNNPKPAFYVYNSGDQPVAGFSVGYYFKVEDGKTPVLDPDLPSYGTATLENLGYNYWRINYLFNGTTLAPGQRLPATGGFRAGLHYSDWSNWDRTDDFSQPEGTLFTKSTAIAGFNSGNALVYGSVPDVAAPVPSQIALGIYALDEGFYENNAVKPRIYIQNLSGASLADFNVRYYFTTDNSKTPAIEDYWTPNSKVSLVNIAGNIWCAYLDFTGCTLQPYGRIPATDGELVGIHYSDWSSWNKADDYSQPPSNGFSLTNKVTAFNKAGKCIYGMIP